MKNLYWKLLLNTKLSLLSFVLLIPYNLPAQSLVQLSKIQCHLYLQPDSIIYVDDNNITGPWSGTPTYPFQNIPEGLAAADSGVTVYVLPGTYPIANDILVENDVMLFLDTCVIIKFNPTAGLEVNGRLIAFGSRNDSIVFTSAQPTGTWKGIRFVNAENSELSFCKIENSTGINGGAVYLSNSSPKIGNCYFYHNHANSGAGIFAESFSAPEIKNCQFKNNTATLSGGAVYGNISTSFLLEDNTFLNNQSSNGGAVAFENAQAVVSDNIFKQNQATNGGAIWLNGISTDTLEIRWNTLESNTATANGGGVFIENSNAVVFTRNLVYGNNANAGGGIYLNNSNVGILNNTFYSNSSTNQGGGVYSAGGNSVIKNNILWANSGSSSPQIFGTGLVVKYNDIQGGYPGIGNIADYPAFLNTARYDFHLKYYSPCINVGDPLSEKDLEGSTAIIGVYYYHHIPVEILEQPDSIAISAGDNTSFKVSSNWNTNYQWQVSADHGATWQDVSKSSNYANANSAELQIIDAVVDMDSTLYRCKIYGMASPPVYSSVAMLKVYSHIRTKSGSITTCPGNFSIPVIAQVGKAVKINSFSLTLNYSSPALTYSGFTNLNSNLSSGFFFMNAQNGKIYATWISTTTCQIQNDTLFNIQFTGATSTTSLNWDTITPGNCEYSDYYGYIITSHYQNGTVTVNQPPVITAHPSNKEIYEGQNTSFSVTASATSISYQWQVSTNNGTSWVNLQNGSPYSGVTSGTLSLTGVPLSFNANQYRCIVGGTCTPAQISNPALLTVYPASDLITTSIGSSTSCPGLVSIPVTVKDFKAINSFSLTLNYNSNLMSFQSNSNLNNLLQGGTFYSNAADGKIYCIWSSLTPATILDDTLFNLNFMLNTGNSILVWDTITPGNCEFSNFLGLVIPSHYKNGQATGYQPPAISAHPADKQIYEGQNTSFSVTAAATNITYLWQVSTNNGTSWSNLQNGSPYSGVTTSTLSITGAPLSFNTYKYRCIVGGTCTPAQTSNSALLTVYAKSDLIITKVGSTTSCPGLVSIPVTVKYLKAINSFSLTLNYNPTIMSFQSHGNVNDSLQGGALISNSSNGKIYCTWSSLTPATIPDDTLFCLNFNLNTGSSSMIWDTITPGNCEYSNFLGMVIPSHYKNGQATVYQPPLVGLQPVNQTKYENEDAFFTITATGQTITYRWQESIDDGGTWNNLSNVAPYYGTTTVQLKVDNAPLSMNENRYRCVVSGLCTPPAISNEATLFVLPAPQIIITKAPVLPACAGSIVVPVTVQNCDSVGAISLALGYNAGLLNYTGYQNIHSELADGFTVVNAINGKVNFTWISVDPAMVGNAVLVEFLFTAVQGTSNLIWDTITPGYCEYSDYYGHIIKSYYKNGSVTTTNCPTSTDLKVFLEGPFNGSGMSANITPVLPLSQPFNTAPWNYTGTESVTVIPNENIVDWVLVELRETTGDASTATSSKSLAKKAAFVRKDGRIVGMDGSNFPNFNVTITSNLFIVIWHRNHLAVMTGLAVTKDGGTYAYDFSSGINQVYGGILGHKLIGTGIWGMIGGDANSDKQINLLDKTGTWNIQSGKQGYLKGDFNLDRQVNNQDKNNIWVPNLNKVSQVPN